MISKTRINSSLIFATTFAALAACAGGSGDSDKQASEALNGAGATFPYPIYSRWFSDYASETGVRINYQSIGSGGGIRQLSAQTVDFGASDSPMSDEEIANATGGEILHIPTVIGAVVVTYNLGGVTRPLNLTGDVISHIFLGKITRWNDPRIAALNPDAALPAQDILVTHRSDGSGTTFIFSDYLTKADADWRAGPGRGKEISWPVGLGAKGNEGVAGQVKQIPGSIGYVELAYAKQNGLQFANIRNSENQFVTPSIASVTAAAAGAASELSSDTDYRISIVDPPGAESYPISSFTWILVYKDALTTPKGQELVKFFKWMFDEGAPAAEELDYAPLPNEIIAELNRRFDSVK